jgi:hypothetical protein
MVATLLRRIPKCRLEGGIHPPEVPAAAEAAQFGESSKNRSSWVPLASRALSVPSSIPGALNASSMVAIFVGPLELDPNAK